MWLFRNAWEKVKGKSSDEAKSEYVAQFIQVLDKAGGEESAKLKAEVSKLTRWHRALCLGRGADSVGHAGW